MPVNMDFSLIRYEDGILSYGMEPAQPIGQWTIQFQLTKRFGSVVPLVTKNVASGFNNASGIQITNSGLGQMNILINSIDTSGLCEGNYAYSVQRLDSGNQVVLTQGYFLLRDSI